MQKIIYFITQGEFGGAQHYVLDLARNFKDKFEVSIVFGEENKSEKFISEIKKLGINYTVLTELKRDIDIKQDFKALKEIRKYIQKEKPDIIHLNSSKISILASLASFNLKTKVIYTAHGWVFNEDLEKNKKNFYVFAEKLTALWKDRIICVSDFDRQTAINKSICNKKKLITIHNGIPDFELLSKDDARYAICQHFDDHSLFLNNNLVIGSIGYLYKNKGFDYLINATKRLIDQGINVSLVVIGGGEEREELDNLVTQLKLQNNVRILGEIPNASRLLRALDIYVCSSLKEGLSYTVIEAMTAGIPIVATNVGGNSELVEDSKEGLIINPANIDEIVESIKKLKANPDYAQKIANSAHKKAIENFEIEQMVDKTEKVYRTVLSHEL